MGDLPLKRIACIVGCLVLSAGAVGAAPWEPKDATARKYLDDGREAFKAGDYRRAGALFGQSFDTEHNLNAQWNAAQSFAAAGDWPRASTLFDALLADPDLPKTRRAEVETRQRIAARFVAATFAQEARRWDDARGILRKLTAELKPEQERDRASALAMLEAIAVAEAEAAKPSEPAPPAEPEVQQPSPPPAQPRLVTPSRFDDRVSLVLIGAGALGLGVGGALLWSAGQLDDDADATSNDSEAKDLYDRADTRRTIGEITLGVGAAVLVTGIVKFAIVPRARAVPSLAAVDGGGLVVFSGAWP